MALIGTKIWRHLSCYSRAYPQCRASSARYISNGAFKLWWSSLPWSGETNKLISLAKELMEEPDPRELDMIVSTGEQVTIGLTALALIELGIKAKKLHRRAS